MRRSAAGDRPMPRRAFLNGVGVLAAGRRVGDAVADLRFERAESTGDVDVDAKVQSGTLAIDVTDAPRD